MPIDRIFFSLIKLGIGTSELLDRDIKRLLSLSMKQWQELMALAERQGVAAITTDGVQRLYDAYGNGIKATTESPAEWAQWVLECTGMMIQFEHRSIEQKEIISELSEIWAEEGIKMMVFKGQANAIFYERPEHRSTGDIDCWLFGEANRGDEILKRTGVIIDGRWYRHSKISHKGETIENHRMMSHTRGSKRKKAMEGEFKAMLKSSDLKKIEGCGKALMPPAQFNACFLTYHGMHHFLSEGLKMKQVLDWAMFLNVYQEDVDWEAYNGFCKRYKLDQFAMVMNYIATEYLGVKLECEGIFVDGGNAIKIINSTLYDDHYLFSSGGSDWKVRWQLVKNMLGRDRWKYRDIAQENVWRKLWENVSGYLLDKD